MNNAYDGKIEWDEHYRIGNDRIDAEHRIFFDLIATYHTLRMKGTEKARLAMTLEEIVLYARFHFKSEENMMFDLGYPDLQRHQNLHYTLIETLSNKLTGVRLGLYTDDDVDYFLRDWFVDHVMHEDTKVTAYIQGLHA